MMRPVIVFPDAPLPFGNAAARWFWVLLRGLVSRGHEVTAYAVCRSDEERAAAREAFPASLYDLRLFNEEADRGGLRRKWKTWRRPYSYPFSPSLIRDLESRLRDDFDVLHLEQLWTGWVGWNHEARALLNIHYLFEIDLATQQPRGLKDRLLQRTTARAERSLLRHFPHIATLTPRLSQRVKQLAPGAEVRTVPLAIDITQYPFLERGLNIQQPIVTLIGSFDWYPSLTAGERLLTRLWPGIKRAVPAALLHVVGRNAKKALGRFGSTGDVRFFENVPDIAPHFQNADVMVYAPARGSGMKVKVLESFAFGLPVVTTTEGVEGIPAVTGQHAEIADDDAALIDATVRLLLDGDHWTAVRRDARQLVETHCDPESSLDKVETCYEEIRAR